MSDVMLFGVLKMPYEMAMGHELSRRQYWQRAQEAAERLERAEAELARLREQEPVAWKHDCAALCTNDVELWIDACPHCGKPRTAAPPAQPAEPVAWMVEGWHEGKLIARIPHLSLEKAKESAAVFSQHYTTTKIVLLYDAPPAPAAVPLTDGDELWLWRNGDHLLAFRHLYPCYSPGGDPMTLGEPVARAVFRSSHDRATKQEE